MFLEEEFSLSSIQSCSSELNMCAKVKTINQLKRKKGKDCAAQQNLEILASIQSKVWITRLTSSYQLVRKKFYTRGISTQLSTKFGIVQLNLQ